MTAGSDLWLHRVAPVPSARVHLVCFPHAGGSVSFFRKWGDALPGVEVHAVRYPGRAERMAEPPPTDLRAMAGSIAQALLPVADRPLALFGHSMGAAVALETARSLEHLEVEVAHLFASGSRDAPYPSAEELAHDGGDEDDAEVVARLLTLGGTDPELARDPDFQELVLPYVRGDSTMFHAYVPGDVPPLRCPVTTIAGDRDPDADRRPWRELTSGQVRSISVAGDHFYLVADPPFGTVVNALRPAPVR